MIRDLCPFRATKTGRWWGFYKDGGKRKELEIDVIQLNENTKDILFVECKWKDLSYNDARKIFSDLKEKSRFVQWNNGMRKEYFGLVAKSIGGKKKFREMGFFVFDLDDF